MGAIFRKMITLVRRYSTVRSVSVLLFRQTAAPDLPAAATIRPVTPDTVRDALPMAGAAKVEEFRAFLARGDLGFYAYDGGTVIHHSWVRRGPDRRPLWHSYVPWTIPAGDAYLHYCETAPAARGRGIYPTVLALAAARARSAGARDAWIATIAENPASVRGIVKAGFREERRFELRVIFGFGRAREVAPGGRDSVG